MLLFIIPKITCYLTMLFDYDYDFDYEYDYDYE